MSSDWQYKPIDWSDPQQNSGSDSLGNQPTQLSAGNSSDFQVYHSDEIVSPPPPPPFSDGPPSTGPYTANPFGTTLGGGYAVQPVPVARNHPWRWMVAPLAILLVLCLGGSAFAFLAYRTFTAKDTPGSSSAPGGTDTGQGTNTTGPVVVSVGAQPTIVIDRNAGAVHITTGPDKSVTIQSETPRSSDRPITYTRSGDGQMITFSLENVETETVDLKVPPRSNLNITTNGDDITVDGVTGVVQLSSNAGALTATHMTLMGTSSLKDNARNITFSGSLTPDGKYTFDTNAGNVTLTLPANAAFHVDVSNNGGLIQSDFPQVVISSGYEAHGDVGQPPYAQVTVSSNGGAIKILKANG